MENIILPEGYSAYTYSPTVAEWATLEKSTRDYILWDIVDEINDCNTSLYLLETNRETGETFEQVTKRKVLLEQRKQTFDEYETMRHSSSLN